MNTTMSDTELVITRVFDAPRELVWQAWTDPDQMLKWMGPRGFTGKSVELEARVGGKTRTCMVGPDGEEHWASGETKELVEPERLVFTTAWEDPPGVRGHETLVTITLVELGGGKTEMTFEQRAFDSVESREGHQEGWTEAFDCLGEYLAG